MLDRRRASEGCRRTFEGGCDGLMDQKSEQMISQRGREVMSRKGKGPTEVVFKLKACKDGIDHDVDRTLGVRKDVRAEFLVQGEKRRRRVQRTDD
jgi:hypothetical protein